MATNDTKTCKPCSRRGLTVVAAKFCTDCDEAQCSACTEVHDSFKAFENHHTVSLEVCFNLQVDRNCNNHADMLLDFFCTAHDRLCCRQCIASEHRSCDQVLPIEVASKNVRKSVLFGNVREDVREITDMFTGLLNQRVESKATIGDMKQNILSETDRLKDDALTKIMSMHTKIRDEVESVFEKLKDDEKDENNTIENERKTVDSFKDKLALMEEHGSDIQLFSFLYKEASSLSSSAKTLQDIISTQKSPDVKLEAVDLFSGVSSMGKIKVVDRELSTALKPLRLKSAQDLMISRKSPTQFQLERKLKLPGTCTGIDILIDGRLVLSNCSGTYLLLVRADGQSQDGKIELGSGPWGVAVHPETGDVYVTLPNLSQVKVVNVQSKAVRKISVPGSVYGIVLMNDKMALGGHGKLYICNLDGSNVSTFNVGSYTLYSIKLLKNSTRNAEEFLIYESDSNIVHRVTTAGKTLQSQTSEHGGPINSAIGLEGDNYVVCCHANKVLRIDRDGTWKEVPLEAGVLKEPYSIAFNTTHSKMYIANGYPAELLVFSCS